VPARVRLGRRWAALSQPAPLPPPSARSSISISPKISPPHQNTPNGKKTWHEGSGGRRPPCTVFYRARAPAEHGLKDTRRRACRAETTEHKADGRRRSCPRLACLRRRSSCACIVAPQTRTRDTTWNAGGLVQASPDWVYRTIKSGPAPL